MDSVNYTAARAKCICKSTVDAGHVHHSGKYYRDMPVKWGITEEELQKKTKTNSNYRWTMIFFKLNCTCKILFVTLCLHENIVIGPSSFDQLG